MIEFRGESKKPVRVGTSHTVDMDAGEVTNVRRNAFTMLPCGPDVCQECAVDHPHGDPHNQQSLYYQYWFYSRHGRWPTWTDAMSHCTPELQVRWKSLLIDQMKKHGIPVPEALREGTTPRS
jgi:hypothetical protein